MIQMLQLSYRKVLWYYIVICWLTFWLSISMCFHVDMLLDLAFVTVVRNKFVVSDKGEV